MFRATPHMRLGSGTLVLVAVLVGTGCGDDSRPATGEGSPKVERRAMPDPADFVTTIDNPYLPLLPGTRWIYASTSSEGDERIVVEVTDEVRDVAGVTATVVHDTVTDERGRIVEDTFDWFAQDADGNVWYLGEDTKAYANGDVSTEGSWEAGVDGAEAGIVMLSDPAPGDAYQQEYYEGEAEDQAEVLALDAEVTVPFGTFNDMVKTADFTPLEPDVVEHKYYARGIGFVFEEMVEGGDDRVSLVAMARP
jgi:hypothetical protein